MVLLGQQAERYVKSVGIKISIQFKQVTGGKARRLGKSLRHDSLHPVITGNKFRPNAIPFACNDNALHREGGIGLCI